MSTIADAVAKIKDEHTKKVAESIYNLSSLILNNVPMGNAAQEALVEIHNYAIPLILDYFLKKKDNQSNIDECNYTSLMNKLKTIQPENKTTNFENQLGVLNGLLVQVTKSNSVRELKLDLLNLYNNTSINISIAANSEDDLTKLFDAVYLTYFNKKLQHLYSNSFETNTNSDDTESVIKNHTGVFWDKNIINQIFVFLINLISEIEKNKSITDFKHDKITNVGYLSKQGANNKTVTDFDAKMRRLLLLQEVVLYNNAQQMSDMKLLINKLLFMKREDIQDDISSSAKLKGGGGLKTGMYRRISRQNPLENRGLLRTMLMMTATAKSTQSHAGNLGKGDKVLSYYASENMKTNFTHTKYPEYLTSLLISNTSNVNLEQTITAEKTLNDNMINQDCGTDVIIKNTLENSSIDKQVPSINMFSGKLTIDFADGKTISSEQIGTLSYILPNLIGGLFEGISNIIIDYLKKPSSNAPKLFHKDSLLDLSIKGDEVCELSLLTMSNYIYPLYNIFYKNLINLYIPIDFDSLYSFSDSNAAKFAQQKQNQMNPKAQGLLTNHHSSLMGGGNVYTVTRKKYKKHNSAMKYKRTIKYHN